MDWRIIKVALLRRKNLRGKTMEEEENTIPLQTAKYCLGIA
jgi:hypothetical protein